MTDVKKTYKNYVDGNYVRSESGKVYAIDLKKEKFEMVGKLSTLIDNKAYYIIFVRLCI